MRVVLSAPNKLVTMCSRLHKKLSGHGKECSFWSKKLNRYILCRSAAVYRLPLSCGKVYVDQTGRCVDTRLKEHLSSLKGTGGLHLQVHCRECGCKLLERNIDCSDIKIKLLGSLWKPFISIQKGKDVLTSHL